MSEIKLMLAGDNDSPIWYSNEPGYYHHHYDTIIKEVIRFTGLEKADISLARKEGRVRVFKSYLPTLFPPKPVILYNVDYVDKMYNDSRGNDDMLRVLTAHELGHILFYHVFYPSHIDWERDHNQELQADHYAGFLAYKMKVCICDALKWLYIVNPIPATTSHPARKKRRDALIEGYKNAMIEANDYSYMAWPVYNDGPLIAGSNFNNCGTLSPSSVIDTTLYVEADTTQHQFLIPGTGITLRLNDTVTNRNTDKTVSISASADTSFSWVLTIRDQKLPRKQRRQQYYIDKKGTIWRDGKKADTTATQQLQ
jgi:hypothetical protein